MSAGAVTRPPVIYIIAGEASGDLLGAHLLRALKQHLPAAKVHGVGGPRMTAEGLSSLFPYHELSIMGFVEILPHIMKVMARISSVVDDVLAKRPDIIITIDSPGFNFRVVERLRKENIAAKFLHYVAPTVWAYNPKRAEKCAKLFDHMLLLLPFEAPYFEAVGLPCTCVGHPVVAETSIGDAQAFRQKFDIAPDTMLFCLLPGSRAGEIKTHMPIFARAVTLLSSAYPNLAITVAVPKYAAANVTPFFQGCPFRAIIAVDDEEKKNAIAASNFAFVKSGTIGLEVAMAGIPMLIAYRVHAISAWILRRKCKIPFVNLINILAQREVIPEMLQKLCEPEMLAAVAHDLLADAAKQQAQIAGAKDALAQMLPPNGARPSELAAQTVLQLLAQ